MFSIFGAKHSPLMLDANSLNFFLQEKNRILEWEIQEIAVRAAMICVHLVIRELGLQIALLHSSLPRSA